MEYTADNSHSVVAATRKEAFIRACEERRSENDAVILARWIYAAAVALVLFPHERDHFPPERSGAQYEERMSSRLHSPAGLAVFFGVVDEVRMQ